MLATLGEEKGRQTDGKRGDRSGMWRRAAGVERDLWSRSRATRQRAQGWAVEADGSGRLSRWTGGTRPEKKKGNWVYEERCMSV